MIEKIEIKELIFSQNEILITIDIVNNQITYIKNNIIIKDEKYYLNDKNITDLIKEYITYWDNEYIDNTIVDGIKTELNIFTNKEILTYKFINKYPHNYNIFISNLKRMVNITW